MLKNCEVFIYIDLEKALKDGVPFYFYEDNVIFTPGIEGVLSKEYIYKVLNLKGE